MCLLNVDSNILRQLIIETEGSSKTSVTIAEITRLTHKPQCNRSLARDTNIIIAYENCTLLGRNNLEEHSFQLLRGGSLKSPIIVLCLFQP